MKNWKQSTFFGIVVIIVLVFTACSPEPKPEHTHEWKWVVTTPATIETVGLETETCSICGKINGTRLIPKLPITSMEDLSTYLNSQSGINDIENPIPLLIAISLGSMTEETSGWHELLTVINNINKFVTLDLSTCTMDGVVFKPDFNFQTGKDKIVGIILPNVAESTEGGSFIGCAFRGFTNLKSFSAASLTSISRGAFESCPLTNVILPEGLIAINDYAFQECPLTEIILPSSLSSIGLGAFIYCSNLKTVTCLATIPPTLEGRYVFYDGINLTENFWATPTSIKVPSGSVEAYKSAWNSEQNEYADLIVALQ